MSGDPRMERYTFDPNYEPTIDELEEEENRWRRQDQAPMVLINWRRIDMDSEQPVFFDEDMNRGDR